MTTTPDKKIPRHELWRALTATTEAALACGALHRIESREQILEDAGISFVVRVAKTLQLKAKERTLSATDEPSFDPFLPPEPPLTVGAIGDGHLAVLNKYSVVPHHLLIVTRHFEAQECLLTPADLAALCWCLREVDGLGFYNGGNVAGASQAHKHLQLIPALRPEDSHAFPIEAVLPAPLGTSPHQHDTLPFPHRITGLPPGLFEAPGEASALCFRLYRDMLIELGHEPQERDGREYQSAPYNLLLTRRWLMLVPRTSEFFGEISINAMGFAGSLFVMDEEGMEAIRRVGPVAILQAVTS